MSNNLGNFIKRIGFLIAVSGGTLLIGSCSFKGIGAGLLSEFLTTGGSSTLGTGLSSVLGQLAGSST